MKWCFLNWSFYHTIFEYHNIWIFITIFEYVIFEFYHNIFEYIPNIFIEFVLLETATKIGLFRLSGPRNITVHGQTILLLVVESGTRKFSCLSVECLSVESGTYDVICQFCTVWGMVVESEVLKARNCALSKFSLPMHSSEKPAACQVVVRRSLRFTLSRRAYGDNSYQATTHIRGQLINFKKRQLITIKTHIRKSKST